MALGVAATTGALATMAVFAKSAAMRFAAGEETRSALVARSFEFAAALAVLAFGLLLLLGERGGGLRRRSGRSEHQLAADQRQRSRHQRAKHAVRHARGEMAANRDARKRAGQ